MDINFAETKAIADTLPIGLYAKRRIPVSMSDKEDTSYYNPVSDEIVISYPIIKCGLEKAVADPSFKETAVRSMEYHEVSHAILTPNNLPMPDHLNVFEDERIETILGDYYMDVDFKKQVLLINGYTSKSEIKAPTSPFEYFYQIVRFGIGDKALVDEATDIIKRYSHMTRSNNSYSWEYKCVVDDFYKKVCGEYPKYKAESGSSGDGDSSKDGSGSSSAIYDRMGNGAAKDGKASGKPSKESGMNGSASGKPNEKGENEANSASDDSALDKRDCPLSKEEINNIFEDFFNNNPYIDNSLTQRMEMIINNFSKRNNSGSSMNAYSGQFNARHVGRRDDYKFWDKPTTVNGANKFGSLHLNLFIDESGSFGWSQEPMNKLLHTLTEVEAKNPNFTLDVVFCGMGERIVKDKRGRIFCASGGNKLDKQIYEIYRKLQKPNTFNYNIACFDGDACSDGGRGDHGFGAFDHNNCVIISDDDNERYISQDVKSAKVIYTTDYAEKLIDNVVEVLSKAFR